MFYKFNRGIIITFLLLGLQTGVIIPSLGRQQNKPPKEAIIQRALNLPELRKHFSHLPRYRNDKETYFYLLANAVRDTSLDLFIRSFPVEVVQKKTLEENNIKNYLVIKSLEISGKNAAITIYYKSPRLAYFEEKFLKIGVQLNKKQNNWIATNSQIDKMALKYF